MRRSTPPYSGRSAFVMSAAAALGVRQRRQRRHTSSSTPPLGKRDSPRRGRIAPSAVLAASRLAPAACPTSRTRGRCPRRAAPGRPFVMVEHWHAVHMMPAEGHQHLSRDVPGKTRPARTALRTRSGQVAIIAPGLRSYCNGRRIAGWSDDPRTSLDPCASCAGIVWCFEPASIRAFP